MSIHHFPRRPTPTPREQWLHIASVITVYVADLAIVGLVIYYLNPFPI